MGPAIAAPDRPGRQTTKLRPCLAGSALGVLGAALAGSFRRLIPAFAVPTLISPRVDAVVIAFAALLACAVTLLAGVAPALLGSRQR
jgi:hypothetical protein